MAEERLQQAGIARYQAIKNLARDMFHIAAGAAIAQRHRSAAYQPNDTKWVEKSVCENMQR